MVAMPHVRKGVEADAIQREDSRGRGSEKQVRGEGTDGWKEHVELRLSVVPTADKHLDDTNHDIRIRVERFWHRCKASHALVRRMERWSRLNATCMVRSVANPRRLDRGLGLQGASEF